MDYFHVFVRQEGDADLRLLASDLAKEEIERRIGKPYRRGTAIVQGGTIIPVASLRAIRICRTDATFEQAYSSEHAVQSKQLEELNRNGGVYFASVGPGHDDMAESFEDVTEKFLRGKEPGNARTPSLLVSLVNHPIVSTVLGGIVLAGLVYYLGWK
ncbi:MAG: hypothetical protein V4864_13470 [Pseudomonadota bacterium]